MFRVATCAKIMMIRATDQVTTIELVIGIGPICPICGAACGKASCSAFCASGAAALSVWPNSAEKMDPARSRRDTTTANFVNKRIALVNPTKSGKYPFPLRKTDNFAGSWENLHESEIFHKRFFPVVVTLLHKPSMTMKQ